jgi:MFS family permease
VCFVSGLIAAQALGLPFNEMMNWRWIMVIAAGLSGSMAAFSFFATAPSDEGDKEPGEETSLLGEKKKDLSMYQLIKSKDTAISTGRMSFPSCYPLCILLTGLVRVIIVTQIVTQLSGISPVLYFSTSILRSVFHGQAGLISVLVLLIKLPASLLTIYILPRWGSQHTLTRSYMAMFVCLLALAFSLNATLPYVSFAAIIGFFLSYGLGPGPVTWVVLSEVLPSEARTAGSSLGQACAAVTGFMMVSLSLLALDARSAPSGHTLIFSPPPSYPCRNSSHT